MRAYFLIVLAVSFTVVCVSPGAAQDRPYFITYGHQLEEPGTLEVEAASAFAPQRGGHSFLAGWTEFEYGVTGWWTTELYLDGQSTFHDSTLFTGVRWENRFRPLMREHWINPVLYVEFENLSGADKAMLEVVGFDGELGHAEPNAATRLEHKHEVELKLILSSNYKGWNVSENFIGEKNLGPDPWEFGYTLGASRPLALAASPRKCRFCPENFVAGAEVYGGLGTASRLTFSGTSHYFAPVLAWQLPSGFSLRASPGWGLTDTSHRFVLRWGISYEITDFSRKVKSLFQ